MEASQVPQSPYGVKLQKLEHLQWTITEGRNKLMKLGLNYWVVADTLINTKLSDDQ